MRGKFHWVGVSSAAVLVSCFAGHANAQVTSSATAVAETSEAQQTSIGDIVVTAERRSSSVQRTGLAIDALDAGALVNSGGVKDARDLALAVPSVHIANLGLYTNVYIHGVGGGVSNPYGTPAVAFSIDGVFLDEASAPGTAFYDLARLEVVKGPQGTLYGRNATAGALNLIPNRPGKDFEGAFTAQYGNYDALELEGMVNIPISSTLASRVAFKTIRHDGYLTNGANDADSKAIRAQLLWEPSDRFTLQAYLDFSQAGGNGHQPIPLYPGVDFSTFRTGAIVPGLAADQRYLNPNNKWTGLKPSVLYPSLIPAPYPQLIPLAGDDVGVNNKQYIAKLEANVDLGFANLTVIPAYVRTRNDAVFYEAAFRAGQIQNVDQYTLEARLASNNDGPLRWIIGGYFFHTDANARADFYQEGVSDITLLLDSYGSTSKAAFAQATYSLSDALRLTAGVRYTAEKKSESGQTIVGNLFLFPAPTPATCSAPFTFYPAVAGGQEQPARCGTPNAGRLKFESIDYKFGLEVDLGPSNLLYVNVSSGFKSGGFNPGSPPNTYPPERLKDYDFGIKNRFLDGRLQVNVEAFYWDYKNQQAQAFGPINPRGYAYIVYPSKSHIYGAGIDVVAAITDNDRLSGTLEYQVGKYDRYQTLSIPQLGVVGVDGSGETRPYTPKWVGRIDYTHSFDLGQSGRIDFNINSLLQTKQYVSTTPKIASRFAQQDGYHKSNATLTYYSPDERYNVAVFVNNIENKFTVNSIQLSSTTGNYFAYVDSPRTYGIRVGARF